MAADNVTVLMLYLRLANLAVSAYLLKALFSFALLHNGSLSKTMKLMLGAVLLFFAVELVQVFRLIPSPESELLQSAFTFAFLLLLLSATLEMRKGVLAHEHLVRHRHKHRISDVE